MKLAPYGLVNAKMHGLESFKNTADVIKIKFM